MSYQPIQKEAYTVDLDKMVEVIRTMSYARIVFNATPPVPIEKKRGKYYEIGEKSEIRYNFDLVAPEYSRFDTIERNPAIPVFQGNLGYTRHELKRIQSDILPLDSRQRMLLEEIIEDEERVAFAGDASTQVGSFDAAANHTDYTVPLDMTSFATGVKTFHQSITQLRQLLKNKFQGATLYQVWSLDVDDRARSTLNSDETETLYDYISKRLGGADKIVATPYLGSETGAAANSSVLVPKDRRNMELITSALEIVSGLTTLKGLEVEVALRSRPVFYRGVKSCLYEDTVDITP